jgi:hypothetical protein
MYITHDQAAVFDAEMLLEFLALQAPEGHHLDYKQALSGKSKSHRSREFLKDVTAFANANGGDILIGVSEPGATADVSSQIVGIADVETTAHDLERLAASGAIDPRIPGLVIHPFRINEDTGVILVHVPPSLGRPHMVKYEKHSSFHIRHSESVQQMTSFDIKQAVLTAASAELQAREYLTSMRSDFVRFFIENSPGFILHASPIIRPEAPLDVMASTVTEALRDKTRYEQHGGERFGLYSMPRPIPTIHGIQGRESSSDPIWLSEYHRNGYIGVAFKLTEYDKSGAKHDGPYVLGTHHSHLFIAFAELCNSLVAASEFDTPYVLQCLFFNAQGTRFMPGGMRYSDAYTRALIEWPMVVRQTGISFRETAEHWIDLLFNAYGLNRAECNQ